MMRLLLQHCLTLLPAVCTAPALLNALRCPLVPPLCAAVLAPAKPWCLHWQHRVQTAQKAAEEELRKHWNLTWLAELLGRWCEEHCLDLQSPLAYAVYLRWQNLPANVAVWAERLVAEEAPAHQTDTTVLGCPTKH